MNVSGTDVSLFYQNESTVFKDFSSLVHSKSDMCSEGEERGDGGKKKKT